MTIDTDLSRKAALKRFVRTSYGPAGTLSLHRAALGADLVRAPLNLVLAPVFILTRLAALAAKALGREKGAHWLASRKVLLDTKVARTAAERTSAFIAELDAGGLGPRAPEAAVTRAVDNYVSTRSAVAEIVTMLVFLAAGLTLFHRATPGLVSLAGPVAELRALGQAIDRFPLGPFLGRVYYDVFPVALPLWQVVLTGLALALVSALVTSFAGLIADPVQVVTGSHRRRLERLIARLEQGQDGGLAREHLAARVGDLSDLALSLWRMLRG